MGFFKKKRGERMRSKRSFAEQLFSSTSSRRKQKKYNTGLGGGSLDLGLGDLF